ncbi:hypothetical protein AVEN_5377-1 [Araneus ventricosus]|uniref:F-box domain-containing protein n=1 Tax=Araneus ventricosus TaxID=182803 RepID=A0A4Y2UG90_ARAVE|nr:hypothetical protein AVEN_5377-1 [Araneus ventricosus]
MEEKEKNFCTVNWAELPSPAIEKVFIYTSRADQDSMSKVCRKWNHEYGSPALWKIFKFILSRHRCSTEIYPEVQAARKYGNMFKYVDIKFNSVRRNCINLMFVQVKLFLEAMSRSSQLSSIKVINFGNYFKHLSDGQNTVLFQTLNEFFNTQKNLNTVIFIKSEFGQEEGLVILNNVFNCDNNKIRKLTLRGFVKENNNRVLSEDYAETFAGVIAKISQVKVLEIDYNLFFEKLIHDLTSERLQLPSTASGMTEIHLLCEGKNYRNFRGIHSQTWRRVKRMFRNLEVHMNIKIYSNLMSETRRYLTDGIPLKSLDFTFQKVFVSAGTTLTSMLTYLQTCSLHEHLENISIVYKGHIDDFSGSVVPFFQSCLNLVVFCIYVTYAPDNIESILTSLLENHSTSLKICKIKFDYVNNNYSAQYLYSLSENFAPLFMNRGIVLNVEYPFPYRRMQGSS